ncbi:hypothetical protein [Rhodopirellula europaea]|uniref:hypothetical protein n=1 Tax=Rhodopirellula europaea TaxID=1263866 RepID=UPI003D26C966
MSINHQNFADAHLLAHTHDFILAPHASPSRFRLPPDLSSDERLAPDTDLNLLRAFVRQELLEADACLVHRLITCFATWRDSHIMILIEEFLERQYDNDSTQLDP